MNELMLWAALIALPVVLLYPVIGKIRRRGRMDRPDGLYTVYEPEQAEDVTFEIVAVHGLGAHPEYTWTGTSSASTGSGDVKRIHLLRDLLKDDFPTARILAFAHNSDWLINAPVKSAQQIGERLLDELVKHRKKQQIVPRDSARGGHGAILIDITKDHSGLNKCRGRDDPLYHSLQEQLRTLRPTTTPTLNGDQQYVVDKLRTVEDAAFNSRVNEHVATCLGNTRHELLGTISQWIKAPITREHAYWLRGKAGTGKSTIARTVADTLDRQDRLAASFFFKRDELDRSSARYVFTSIAAQIAQKLPAVAEHMRNTIEAKPSIATMALGEQFRRLIMQPMEAASRETSTTMTVVIDALDECEGDEDITTIIKLLLQTDRSTVVPLKFFVTSRFELPIRLGFKGVQDKFIEVSIDEIPWPTIERDITAFLKFRLGEIRSMFELASDWPDPTQFRRLVTNSVPLFIFAATTCRFIEDCRQGGDGPDDRLQKILQHEARGNLDQIYLPVLDRMVHGLKFAAQLNAINEFKLIVGSIITVANPLGAAPLASLLDISTGKVNNRLGMLHSILDVPTNATIPIRIFHESFRDFVIDPEMSQSFYVDEKATHKMLADRCLALLSHGGHLKQDICGLEAPGRLRTVLDKPKIDRCLPLHVQYACLYWVHHLKKSGVKLNDEHQALSFLLEHCLHWLEALSLMGMISEGIRLINELQGLIDSVAFSPDGQTVASGSLDNTIKLWDAQTGKERQTLEGHSDSVRSVAFSTNGQTVASGSDDHTIKLWDAQTGKERQTLEGHSDSVRSVAFSPNGQTVASGSDDHTIKLWDAQTGKERQTLEEHSGVVSSVAFSPDGQMVASGSVDETIKLWDAQTGKVRQTLDGHSDEVWSVAFSPDGQTVASSSYDCTIKLWDTQTGRERQTIEGHSNYVQSVAFSPDGQTVASGSYDRTVKLWDAQTGKERQTLEGHSNSVLSVAFSPDGQMVASGSVDETIKLWDAQTGKERQTLDGHSDEVWSVAFSPDGQTVASGSDDHTIKLWDAQTGKERQTLEGHSDSVRSVAFSTNGQTVASGSDDHTIKLWDAQTGKERQTLKWHSGVVLSVAFSPDGQMVASGSDDHTIKLWDARTGKERQTLKWHSGVVLSVSFSPDGQMVASGSYDRTIKLWDAQTGKERQTLEGHSNVVLSVAFSPDGQTVASGSSDNTIKLWDAQTGKERQTLGGHSGGVWSVAFSADGQTVASGSHDFTIKLWDAQTGKERQTLEGHSNAVLSVAFSPNGQTVASGSNDNTIKLWDAQTGKERQTLEGRPDSVASIVGRIPGQPDPHVSVANDWVTFGNENLIWLPAEYRSFISSDIQHDRLALGYSTGKVLIIGSRND
ncbi:vegetative incompatibility protein HET-E-1 [Penicillium nucicola]|uniref:vegetative incompatibility protein HET-E-1 n=1 Tax=Penicillium nucicola TaxID=1850975 RepID=UPI00254502B0|nr:vegetative incompatibility protein HET-E-1 [Penicillium nucicola]KAJ5742536.1 vegetative incompatibility protein HET-E-1 [Penicillium nucicola]